MPAVTVESRPTNPKILLQSAALTVTITPGKGGDITSIVHQSTGQEILWQTPWGGRPSGFALPGSDSTDAWMQQYPGGWQLLLPNASAACTDQGIQHGFHGEAAVSPWDWTVEDDTLCLSLAFYTLPLTMARRFRIDNDVLIIDEVIANTSAESVALIWCHHPGFGGALLAGPARITTGAQKITVDDQPDARGNALYPGYESAWPYSLGQDGEQKDLRHPLDGQHAMAYLHDFTAGWVALTRIDGAIGMALSWDHTLFPCAWLWQELGGSTGRPWFGRGRVIGLEPATTWPGRGLAAAKATNRPLLQLGAGESRATTLRLHVFTGLSEVDAVSEGRATGPVAPQ